MADDKKIIIDEDWKSQVQAEKDAAAKGKPDEATAEPPMSPSSAGESSMPLASFELLLTMLATEALVALGQLANPATGEVQVHRPQAQYLIDMIDVLREKTKGNLTPNEFQLIETILHQLRMAYVETASQSSS